MKKIIKGIKDTTKKGTGRVRTEAGEIGKIIKSSKKEIVGSFLAFLPSPIPGIGLFVAIVMVGSKYYKSKKKKKKTIENKEDSGTTDSPFSFSQNLC